MITLLLLSSLCEAKRSPFFSSKTYDIAYRNLETQKESTDDKLREYRTQASKIKASEMNDLIEKIQTLPNEAEQYVEVELGDEVEKLARSKDLKDSESLKREGQKYIKVIKADVERLVAAIQKHAAKRK